MSKQKKYHYIYKTTCTITGKFYVGMHSTDNLEDGYLGSGKILGYSRHKYGDENHTKEILSFCSSRDELKQKEREVVNEDLLKQPLNINLKYGGDGGGKLWSEEHAKKFHRAGWEKMMASQTPEQRTARAIKANKNRQTNGYVCENKISDACLLAASKSEKRKVTMQERGHMQGEKNSQFGTCWVTNGTKSVKIKKDLLEEYLAKGYSRGRTIRKIAGVV